MTNDVLEAAGDRWRLIFTRHLAHPPEKVWRAIIDAEHRDTWFPQRIQGDWRVGEPLKFVSEYGDFDGEVLAIEPPRVLEFRWGTDTIRLEVAPESGGSVLRLIDTFDEKGKAARDAAGWAVCLEALARAIDGQPTGADSSHSAWRAAHARYTEQFGPEAATIGPPPSTSLH